MCIGEAYMVTTESTLCKTDNSRPMLRGRVIYVHPRYRFAVLEFQGVHGTFRESYFPEQLTRSRLVK